jgi:hypothetical protein
VSTLHELAAVAAFSPTPPGMLPRDSPAKRLCAVPSPQIANDPVHCAHIAL